MNVGNFLLLSFFFVSTLSPLDQAGPWKEFDPLDYKTSIHSKNSTQTAALSELTDLVLQELDGVTIDTQTHPASMAEETA